MSTLDQLQAGNEATIRQVYDDNRSSFFAFAGKYGLSREDMSDIYQDAIIALVENARKGKLVNLKSTISTYLFAIGKYMIYRKKKTTTPIALEEATMPAEMEWETYDAAAQEDLTVRIGRNFEKLGEQCRRLLRLFYYEGRKLDEITRLMEYENKDVAKSQKSRCIKQLRTMIEKNG